jgi:membrane protease YdiL (CAAX protease family)
LRKENWFESLEAVLIFSVPLLFAIPLYVTGFLSESSGNLILYPIYIVGSIVLTRHNGRSLAEIGLTRKGFVPSLGNSILLVVTFSVSRFIVSGLKFSADVSSWEAVTYNLLYWLLSGFGQEILFRGLIMFSFKRWKGWKVALLVSTVLFGAIHVFSYNISGIFLVSMIGGLWGWIALKTNNIVGTAVAHSLFNFLFQFMLVS